MRNSNCSLMRPVANRMVLVWLAVVPRVSAAPIPWVQRDPIVISGAADRPARLKSADLDGDGNLDVIAANQDDNKLLWYRQTGPATREFEPLVAVYLPGSGNRWVDAADVDGDKDLDILYATASIYLNSSFDVFGWIENRDGDASSWQDHTIATGMDNAFAIEAADIDGDGDQDAFFTSEGDGIVGWFENVHGSGSAWETHLIDTHAPGGGAIRVADFDGDGAPDAAAVLSDASSVIWYQNDVRNSNTFTRHVLFDGLIGAIDLDVGDLDADGDADMVVLGSTSRQAIWLQNDGDAKQPEFMLHSFPSLLQEPVAVTIGDLDGDNDTDIVISLGRPDARLIWFENDGKIAPSFTEREMRSLETLHSAALLSVDIDEDKDMDLLAGVTGQRSIRLYENGDSAPADWPWTFVDTAPFGGFDSLAVADLEGDGDPDILSAGDHLVWYANNRDGTFSSSPFLPASPWAEAVDMDADGDLDILTRGAWRENDGSAAPSFSNVHVLADRDNISQMGDLDGDGDLDLLGISENKIRLYENSGGQPPVFQASDLVYLRDVDTVRTGDMDRDGDLDLIAYVESFDVPDRIVYLDNAGTQPPIFTEYTVLDHEPRVRDLLVHDLNQDGLLDIVYARDRTGASRSAQLGWLENLGGRPSMFAMRIVDTGDHLEGAGSIQAGDFDRDGDQDILHTVGQIRWYENDGGAAPSFTRHSIAANHRAPTGVRPVDFDLDGDVDLAFISSGDDQLGWLENRTIHRSAVFSRRKVISDAVDGVVSVVAVDLDGDGDVDAVTASRYDDTIAWHRNMGGTPPAFTTIAIDESSDRARVVAVGDLDRDGDQDVVSAATIDDNVSWHENRGNSSSWTKRVLLNHASDPRALAVADLNADGDLDIAVGNDSGYVRWLVNDGNSPPAFALQIIATGQGSIRSVVANDLDHDGDLDLLAASFTGDAVFWYDNTAADGSHWTARPVTTWADGARTTAATDIDQDGRIDVVAGANHSRRITWYRNVAGAPPKFVEGGITSNSSAVMIKPADVDQDGDMDLIEADIGADEIRFYEHLGQHPPEFKCSTVATDLQQVNSIDVADVDGDGDLDILAATTDDDIVGWYENLGGQFALLGEDTAPSSMRPDEEDDVLRVAFLSRGRAGDSCTRLDTLYLRVEAQPGVPLNSLQLNALFDGIRVYLDDGDGVFSSTSDKLIQTADELAVVDGLVEVELDYDTSFEASFETNRTYFVAIELTPEAFYQRPHQFCVTLLTSSPTITLDGTYGRELRPEQVQEVRSTVVHIILEDGDNDGMPAEWEITHFGSELLGDPSADPDKDGHNNLAEYVSGTHPRERSSVLQMEIARTNDRVIVGYDTTANRYYVPEVSTDLPSNAFVTEPATRGTGERVIRIVPLEQPDRYYRVRAELP